MTIHHWEHLFKLLLSFINIDFPWLKAPLHTSNRCGSSRRQWREWPAVNSLRKGNKPCLCSSNKPHNCVCVGNHKLFKYANTASTKRRSGSIVGLFFSLLIKSSGLRDYLQDERQMPTETVMCVSRKNNTSNLASSGLSLVSYLLCTAFFRCRSAFQCLDAILNFRKWILACSCYIVWSGLSK